VKSSGTLEVAMYADFPPWSYKDADNRPAGVDVELGRALAEKLGVSFKPRLFAADENMEDDLRNNVWKGHYLGGGVADVMLHAPVDAAFAAREDKADFFGAYFHEAVTVVYHPDKLAAFETPLALTGHKVGVEIDSISDYYMSGAFNGRLRSVAVRKPSLTDAVAAFKAGEVDAVMAPRGELQGLIKTAQIGDLAFKEQQLVGMLRTAWDVGMAVKSEESKTLRDALAKALDELRSEGRLAAIFAAYGIEYAAPPAATAAR
ncbi:MAG: transporter substrate-binding domain-containing protein, partial [Hyphomicrobium sp.]|nr:transporter substrate-binding domain-containing protein [Hyphomicrobium sp.]